MAKPPGPRLARRSDQESERPAGKLPPKRARVTDDQREEKFLTNAALGADLLTSYVAATGDEPEKPGGCLTVLLVVGLIALLAL